MTHEITTPPIEQKIYILRGRRVMLDRDLAELYQVRPIALRQAVKRNRDRFPADFLFQLSEREIEIMVSQNVIPSRQSLGGWLPYAFTQEGVAMLSSVLRSPRAVAANIAIMRTFVHLRDRAEGYQELARRLDWLESRYEGRFRIVLSAIRKLMDPTAKSKKSIGFQRMS